MSRAESNYELLNLLVRCAAEVTGRPVIEMAELMADRFGTVNIFDHLEINYVCLCRIVTRLEFELDLSFPHRILPVVINRDGILNGFQWAIREKEQRSGVFNQPAADAEERRTVVVEQGIE